MKASANARKSLIVWLIRVASITMLLFAGLAQTAIAAEPAFGQVKVFAQVPALGFPEGVARRGLLTFVTGPATFGLAGNGIPAKIWVYNTLNGNLVYTKDVVGEDLSQEHANSCAAIDGFGRLYGLNLQLGLIRFDPLLISQQQYSTPFPYLKPCIQVQQGTPCSPMPADLPPLPNDIAFDLFRNAYVTDLLQATVWRVPAGGGEPQIWFQDLKLAPSLNIQGSIGANGIRINPQHIKVYVVVSIDSNSQGASYTLPLVNQPSWGPGRNFEKSYFKPRNDLLQRITEAFPYLYAQLREGSVTITPLILERVRVSTPLQYYVAKGFRHTWRHYFRCRSCAARQASAA